MIVVVGVRRSVDESFLSFLMGGKASTCCFYCKKLWVIGLFEGPKISHRGIQPELNLIKHLKQGFQPAGRNSARGWNSRFSLLSLLFQSERGMQVYTHTYMYARIRGVSSKSEPSQHPALRRRVSGLCGCIMRQEPHSSSCQERGFQQVS